MHIHWIIWTSWLLAAYLLGSIPFGLILGKIKGVDIRAHGSGNLGATNVGRVLGKKLGITCFSLDVLKGLLPTLSFGLYANFTTPNAHMGLAGALSWIAIGAAAIVGHVLPIYLKFKGGKGVATGLGAVLGLWPVMTFAGIAAALTWFITVKIKHYVSLGSIVAAAALPLLVIASSIFFRLTIPETSAFTAVSALLTLMVILRHRSNITRLKQGTESKVSW
jgi:acyl phosphate:glycerol-3-phosphate acyltransferase